MSYIFTKVPTQWSPNTVYHLTDQITLKPAYRAPYTYPQGMILYHDNLYFISTSQSIEDHIKILRQWVIFHSFIFDFKQLCTHFENGWLNEHYQASSIDEIHEDNGKEKNAYPINFDNVGNEIYWLHKPTTVMNYKKLFEQYQQLQDSEMSLLTTYLLDVEQKSANVLQYALFHAQREYWQIFVYVTVLEAIIGHAANCPGSVLSCSVCNKKFTHRQGSEKTWRNDVLSGLISDQAIKDEYLDVINTAYDEIRHPTAHAGVMPIPTYPMQPPGTETYDVDRSVSEFKLNEQALMSLLVLVKAVTRYLLLDRLFRLNTFPPLKPLHFTHIAPGK